MRAPGVEGPGMSPFECFLLFPLLSRTRFAYWRLSFRSLFTTRTVAARSIEITGALQTSQMSLCRALRRHLLLCRLLGLVLVGSPDGQNSAKRNVRNVGRVCDDRKKVR